MTFDTSNFAKSELFDELNLNQLRSEVKGIEQQCDVTKSKSKRRNIDDGYLVLNWQIIDAIYRHEIQNQSIKREWLIIAYLVMCRHVYEKGGIFYTKAGAKIIRSFLHKDIKTAKRVLKELRHVALSNGTSLIQDEGGTAAIPWRVFAHSINDELFHVPRRIIARLTFKAKNGMRRKNSGRLLFKSKSIRLLLLLYRNYEPLSYWGINPFDTVRYEYVRRTDTPAHFDGYDFYFYKNPHNKTRIIQRSLSAELFDKPENQITDSDHDFTGQLLDELIKTGYLNMTTILFDQDEDTPMYRLYYSNEYKRKHFDEFKPLHAEIVKFFSNKLGNCTYINSVFDNSESVSQLIAVCEQDQKVRLIGLLCPDLTPSDEDHQLMKNDCVNSYERWKYAISDDT